MGNPVVVQGTVVPNPAATPSYGGGGGGQSNGLTRDEKKESGCNDVLFAILFIVNVVAIGIVAGVYGPAAFNDLSTDDSSSSSDISFDYTGYLIAAGIVTVISFFGAAFGLFLLMCIPQFLIKTSLIFVTILAGLWCVLAFATGNLLGGVIGVIFFAMSVCYAYFVWSRIPFATINLVTACTAVRKHLSVTLFSYFFAALAGVWSILWVIAFIGVFNKTYKCDASNVCSSPNYGIIFGLFLALYFGAQVIQVRNTCNGWTVVRSCFF